MIANAARDRLPEYIDAEGYHYDPWMFIAVLHCYYEADFHGRPDLGDETRHLHPGIISETLPNVEPRVMLEWMQVFLSELPEAERRNAAHWLETLPRD